MLFKVIGGTTCQSATAEMNMAVEEQHVE